MSSLYNINFFCNFWWSNSKYIKKLIILKKSKNRYNAVNYLIGDFNKVDYRYTFSLHHYNNELHCETHMASMRNLNKLG